MKKNAGRQPKRGTRRTKIISGWIVKWEQQYYQGAPPHKEWCSEHSYLDVASMDDEEGRKERYLKHLKGREDVRNLRVTRLVKWIPQ